MPGFHASEIHNLLPRLGHSRQRRGVRWRLAVPGKSALAEGEAKPAIDLSRRPVKKERFPAADANRRRAPHCSVTRIEKALPPDEKFLAWWKTAEAPFPAW